MIIVMQPDATAEEIQAVEEDIGRLGFTCRKIVGAELTVLAVVGKNTWDYRRHFEVFAGVDRVQPIEEPYRLANRAARPSGTCVAVGPVRIGGEKLVVMAGSCSIETHEQCLAAAQIVKEGGGDILRAGLFKPRTSPYSFQGLGWEGMKWVLEAREATGLPLVAEIMDPRHVERLCESVDMLQIGTRNMQNYNLLKEVGQTRHPVLLKRGMSATLEELLLAAEYILTGGNPSVVLCERGIRTFDRSARFTLDLNAVPSLKRETHLPVVVDPSHGTGHWWMVEPLACAVAAVGADGLMVEVHPNPSEAMSDSAQALDPERFYRLMERLRDIPRYRYPDLAHASL